MTRRTSNGNGVVAGRGTKSARGCGRSVVSVAGRGSTLATLRVTVWPAKRVHAAIGGEQERTGDLQRMASGPPDRNGIGDLRPALAET